MTFSQQIQAKLDQLTKPQGSLGQLEHIALQVALNQRTLTPDVSQALVCICAADHGLAESGVSAFPQAVTRQMVLNFLNGGAAINVFSRQAGADFELLDCGIKEPVVPPANSAATLLNYRIASGTENCLHAEAMTAEQFRQALHYGEERVGHWLQSGYQLIALGEMGIGNTSSAALLMSALTGQPIEQCVGRGTGHDDAGLARKLDILTQARARLDASASPEQIGACFGGFEIVTLAGMIMAAQGTPLTLIVDGFIVTAAALLAEALQPGCCESVLFAHEGDEQAHASLLDHLNADPILKLNLRLGEGSGAALVIPIVRSAVAMLNEMASFTDAGVSGKTP